MKGCGEMFGPTTPGCPGNDSHVGTVQNSHCCPESCPIKNSVRKGPRILESPGILCGATSSILKAGNGAALLLIRNEPDSPGPSHSFCSPKENCTLSMLSKTALFNSWNSLAVVVPLGNGGVPLAAPIDASTCAGSEG